MRRRAIRLRGPAPGIVGTESARLDGRRRRGHGRAAGRRAAPSASPPSACAARSTPTCSSTPNGSGVAPAITWQDNRAAAEAAQLDATLCDADKDAWWGAPLPIGASHVLARMTWMARERPDVYAEHPLRADAEGLLPQGAGRRRRHRSAVELLCRRTRPRLCRAADRPGRRRARALRAVEGFTDVVGEIALGSIRRPRAGRRRNDGRLERPVRRRRVRSRPGRPTSAAPARSSAVASAGARRRARRRHLSEGGGAERSRRADPERRRRVALVGRD